jgi:hypothetical protein
MARPVYSVQLADKAAVSGSWSFGPAAGFAWIVRDVDGWIYPAVGNPTFTIYSPGGATIMSVVGNALGGTPIVWRGRQVIEPGLEFVVASDAPVDFVISGYELSPS